MAITTKVGKDFSYIGPDGKRHYPKGPPTSAPTKDNPFGDSDAWGTDWDTAEQAGMSPETWANMNLAVFEAKRAKISADTAAAVQKAAHNSTDGYRDLTRKDRKAASSPSWEKPTPWPLPKGDDCIRPDLSPEEYKERYDKYRGHPDIQYYQYDVYSDLYRYYPPNEEQMSNKFLPFVVENSTPLHVFKTLLTRSKGMNQVLIASTFNMILNEDIKVLRAKVKDMPEMPLEKLYEELLIKYPVYRVKDEVLATYQNIVQFFPMQNKDVDMWSKELQVYSTNDIMLFFCSMAYTGKPTGEYTDFPYNLIMDNDSTNKILENIQEYVMFADDGVDVKFDNAIELRCFILYHGLFRAMMSPDEDVPVFNASLEFVK